MGVIGFYFPFVLHRRRQAYGGRWIQKEQKIRAVILFLETLENATAPYPNSETAFAKAQLSMPDLCKGAVDFRLLLSF